MGIDEGEPGVMTRKRLEGKTALVTGGAKRIGHAIAMALAEEGVNVVIHYRSSEDEAKQICATIIGLGLKSWTVRADFGNLAESETLIPRTREIAGTLDILINSASVFPPSTLKEMDFVGLIRTVQVNAWAPFVLSRQFAQIFGRGKIVNLLDTRFHGYDRSHVAYILSKQILSSLTRMTALEFAPHITVNGVAPGLILPPPGKEQSYLDGLVNTVPLRRHGSPGDIAEATIYLLKSDFVTGQVIYVDGGSHLKGYGNGSHID